MAAVESTVGAGFVGRGRELAELARSAAQAVAGHGCAVFVTGEPGIGKTTVVERAARSAGGAPVLVGRAVVDDGAPAFWPWLRLLEQPAAAALGLHRGLLDLGDTREPGPAARFHAVERTVRALLAAAEPAGLVLVIDDLQWADDASLRLLRHLCRELGGARVLLLGTCRDPDGAEASLLTEITGLAAVRVLRLPPLGVADVAEYLGPTGGPWAEQVHRHSGGNPLFVRELVRVLAQQDRLAGPAGHLPPVPAELRRLVGYRLSQLGEECHRLLGGCAVIGDEVDLRLLPGDARAELLAEAVSAGVLVEQADEPGRLRFSHGLVRQAAYDALGRAERVRWHARIAAVLRSMAVDEERAVEVARHAVRAAVDGPSRAVAVADCRAAAAVSLRRLAFDDAAHWQRQALALIGDEADEADDAVVERATTLLALADAEYRGGRVAEAVGHCLTVADLAEQLPDGDVAAELLARAATIVHGVAGPAVEIAGLCERALARPEHRHGHAAVLAQYAWALAELGQVDEARAISERALAMAERGGDPAEVIAAVHARHQSLGGPDDVARRLALGTRLSGLAAIADRPDAAVWAHLWRIEAAYQVGTITAVDRELAALGALVDRLGWPLARWQYLRARAARALLAGRFAEAETTALAMRDLGLGIQDAGAQGLFYAFVAGLLQRTGRYTEYEHAFTTTAATLGDLPIVQAHLGRYLLLAGHDDLAAELLARLRPVVGELAMDNRWMPTVALGGELAVGLGDHATAELCYRLTLPYADQYLNSSTSMLGSLSAVLGRVALGLGRHDDALAHFTAAVSMERRVGAVPDLAVAQLGLATALVGRGRPGDRDRALPRAEEALRTARRLGMAPTVAAASALTDGLTGVTSAGLTVREREIAGLVASGRSNRAIAERLVLSERTVETHVRNVLAKVGLANRTQLAAWALRAGYVVELRAGTDAPGVASG
jgi:DNA-binding CsgD family transcriptional regulator